MSYFHSYIYFIIFIKSLLFVLAVSHIYMKINNKTNSNLDKRIVYLKKIDEFIFEVLMAILLIYLFNPMYDHKALFDSHVKILLFLFGFIGKIKCLKFSCGTTGTFVFILPVFCL